jgi:hypothetical protein
MASMKIMAFAQAFAWPESIKDAVGDVQEPGAEAQQQRRKNRHMKPHRAGEEPSPKRSDSWRIQAK